MDNDLHNRIKETLAFFALLKIRTMPDLWIYDLHDRINDDTSASLPCLKFIRSYNSWVQVEKIIFLVSLDK